MLLLVNPPLAFDFHLKAFKFLNFEYSFFYLNSKQVSLIFLHILKLSFQFLAKITIESM